MLSICIPVYNYDLTALVNSLHKQGIDIDIPFEIILVDDASDNYYREINRKLNQLEHVDYVQLDKNIGRAKIRNFLADKANYQYLVFMDCDSMTPDNNYLERYASYCKGRVIICGGRTHHSTPGDECFRLRWLYGTNREEKSAKQRNTNPNNSFMTNNFLITKDLFKTFRLNEAISGYGHEDTYFGYQLKKAGINITHIDNPLIHEGLETSRVFLDKTLEAIHNLLKIYLLTGYDKEFAGMVSLLKTYCNVKRWRLTFIMRFACTFFKNPMKRNLLGSNPKLWVFDLYKLCYIISASETSNPQDTFNISNQ